MNRLLVVVSLAVTLLVAGNASAQATAPSAPPPPSDPLPALPAPDPPSPTIPAPAPAPAPAPSPPPPASGPTPLAEGPVRRGGSGPDSMLKRYTSWDANIEGGIGRVVSSPAETTGLVRVRAGVLVIRDPSFFAVGATYELSHLSAATVGIQAEYLHLESGFWAQIGPLVDVADKAKLGFMGSLGFSVLGLEYQGRDYNAYGYASAVFLKVRIPLGIVGFAIRGR